MKQTQLYTARNIITATSKHFAFLYLCLFNDTKYITSILVVVHNLFVGTTVNFKEFRHSATDPKTETDTCNYEATLLTLEHGGG